MLCSGGSGRCIVMGQFRKKRSRREGGSMRLCQKE